MVRGTSVRWEAYAEAYDLMAAYNPAYQENMARFAAQIRDWRIGPSDVLLELGAGTGNYSIALAEAFPHARVWHVDSNPGMNAIARRKAKKRGLENLRIVQEDVQRFYVAPQTVKAVVCINALFCMPQPRHLIHRIYEWMRPQGYLYVDDIGRVVKMADWFGFIFKSLHGRFGLIRTLVLIFRSRQVIAANRRISRAQQRGEFWTHDLDQFAAQFLSAGFRIDHHFLSYRNYNDGLVCRKPGCECHCVPACPLTRCDRPG